MPAPTLLLICDGRFPAGGHAHSGGLEQAAKAGAVHDSESLFAFLAGRLATVGRTDAHLAAAAWDASTLVELAAIGSEAASRCASPAVRAASRAQARGLLRAAGEIWPFVLGPSEASAVGTAALRQQGPLYPIALGAVGKMLGLDREPTALIIAMASISGPAWAATRLLGIAPFEVAACLARLSAEVERLALEAAAPPRGLGLADLPASGAPLLDIGAEAHDDWEVRLFAS